jgi:hypothetical protein
LYKLHEQITQQLDNGGDAMRQKIEASNGKPTEEMVALLFKSMPSMLEEAVKFGKEIPGLNKLNNEDFTAVLNMKMFDYFIITNSILFMDGESYLFLNDDCVYTRFWMNLLRTKPVIDPLFEFTEVFNSLCLTKKEKGLLIVIMFTMEGRFWFKHVYANKTGFSIKNIIFEFICAKDIKLEDYDTIKDLNEYYTRAIMYEFDLNNRNFEFFMKLRKVYFDYIYF